MNETIINYIKEKRPTISNSSLKTYESILRNLYIKVFDNEDYNFKLFDEEVNKVLTYLKDLPSNKRKTILSALVVITDNNEYRDLMIDDIKEYNKEHAKQVKTENQQDNWIETDELKGLYNSLKDNAMVLYKKKFLNSNDLQDIQNYIIIALYSGKYIPPRRAKDYVNFKIKNIDKLTDNYMDKNTFIFNDYKTAKTYGQQKIKIPKELKAIITKWIKINKTDYLLFDITGQQLNNVKLNQRLNKIFGKKASVNALRHTYLTDKYGDTIDVKNDMENDMSMMGTSLRQETIYIKK